MTQFEVFGLFSLIDVTSRAQQQKTTDKEEAGWHHDVLEKLMVYLACRYARHKPKVEVFVVLKFNGVTLVVNI
ncbi:hypothetical protein QW180_31155 [Vibrio sinaloensis]|nr:hypothetical protein [Vibrio sinaloensis]